MNQLAIAFLTGLAIFGLIELISYLCRVLYGKRKQEEFIVVLPLKGDAPELELSVRRIQHERNWHYQTDCTIYLVDMGMTQ